jgi:nicotinate-nucleotide adenylyltransferase
MTPPQRIGLFGGAFDPPHHAHAALARAAVEQLQLDRLHIIPTGQAWHKSTPLSAAAHRLAMCRLAFGALPGVRIDERELRRDGPSYTIDTLRELRAEYPGAELFLLIGADQAAAFHTWRQAGEIAAMATIAIALRADAAFNPANPLPGIAVEPVHVRALRLPAMPHSATETRALAAAGQPVAHLVAAPVAGYIAEHNLYRS